MAIEPYRFEDILAKVGDGPRWVLAIFLIASLPGFFAGLHNVGSVYLLYTPDHWCSPPPADLQLAFSNNWTMAMIKQHAIPLVNGPSPPKFSRCEIRSRNYTELFRRPFPPGFPEDNGTSFVAHTCSEWIYETDQMASTVVTQWNLVCDYTAYASIGKSCYMMGMFFGSIGFGYLSDKYGRRRTVLICLVQYLSSAMFAALSPYYVVYITFRMLTGMAAIGAFMCTFVLMNETVMPKHRGMLQIFINVWFALGIMALTLAANIFDNWKPFYALITMTSFSMVSFYWIFPESPRWLILQGRKAEAVHYIRMIANVNGKGDNVSDEKLMKMVSKCYAYQVQSEKAGAVRESASVLSLFRTPEMRKHTLICSYLWASISCTYYGITYASPNMGNLRTMVLLNGLMELLSSLSGTLFVKLISRRANVCANLLLTSVLCLAYGLIIPPGNGWLENSVIMGGRFTVALAFAFLYVMTAELFPTDNRNIAMGFNSTTSRFGAVASAFIVDFLSSANAMILFGVQMMLASALCLFLQETGNKKLPETETDVEHFNELEIRDETIEKKVTIVC